MTIASSGTKGTGQTLLSFILFVLLLVPLLRFIYAKRWQALMPRKKREELFTRQMTPIGRFSLMSQTERNPSIITFFIALANENGTKGVDMEVFEELWKARIMNKHERFQCRVPETRKHCFEINERPFEEYCKVVAHPNDHEEFKARVSDFLTSPLDIHRKLWECQVSTGDLGSSGAIIKEPSNQWSNKNDDSETVFLFRNHHCLCDGVSLSTVVSDFCDERDELHGMISAAVKQHEENRKNVGIVSRLPELFMYYVIGTILALSSQLWNMVASSNPFDAFTTSIPSIEERNRSVSWKYLAPVDEAKSILKAVSKESRHAKLNDLFVSLLSSALEKQYNELIQRECMPSEIQSTINVVCPVHLAGGLVMPGRCIGNSIGAFVTSVPFNPKHSFEAISRLRLVSEHLRKVKSTPAAQISWLISSLISRFACDCVAKYAMTHANCHAAAAISNVHGFLDTIHWMGRPVVLTAFLPLPPDIPIGMVVTSYNGKIIMSIDADERVVPDGDRFLDFMIEEYESLRDEAKDRR